MCGIFGAVSLSGPGLRSKGQVIRAGDCLRHRGPDSGGHLESRSAVLGSRRLSIVDLSPRANQPFKSPDGRFWLACNGEIYNASDLRRRYARKGYPFRSVHSDVEPLLPLFMERGTDALDEINGMFAIAFWDMSTRRLLLVRDRAGEKPLYYSRREGELHFASEIQALVAALGAVPRLSADGISDYLALGYCLAPHTMFSGIRKLEAGHVLIADADGMRLRSYWNPVEYTRAASAVAPGRLLEVFDQGLRRQTLSDVPIGAFVSGGLDSSLLITSLAGQMPAGDIHTYAVQFEQTSYDESDWAERVCRSVGTVHHRVRAGQSDLRHALDSLSDRLAEPLGDPAILPVHLLAEAAASEVRVVFSGEGADELFGGYPTYIGHRWAERFNRLPPVISRTVGAAIRHLPVTTRKVSLSFLARRFVEEAGRETLDRHLAWFGALGTDAIDLGPGRRRSGARAVWERLAGIDDTIKRLMVFDLVTYLAENLLTKLDRATMLSSVEARAPFLDRDLMELALSQSADSAVGAVKTKMALKRAAGMRLPRDVVYRRKRGLSVPIAEWINGELRDEVDRLFDADRLRRQGLLEPIRLKRLLDEHRDRRADHGRRLWPLFVLQRWHEHWLENPRAWAQPCEWEGEAPAVVAAAT
jgi:asparagine synthase (glutamine-hydrolysing)